MNAVLMRLRIRRTFGWQEYEVHVPAEAYVLDALEAAGAQDPTLLYRHSCHHAACGSCGLRINGRERLPCITPLTEFKTSGRRLRLEPLRNFPIIGDLLVDPGPFMAQLDSIDMSPIRNAESIMELTGEHGRIERDQHAATEDGPHPSSSFNRLENCIECGLCVSACPMVGRDALYAGPAALAAVGRIVAEPRNHAVSEVLRRVDHEHGLWRCHAAFECTEVCPAGVNPANAIMTLRGILLRSPAIAQPKEKA